MWPHTAPLTHSIKTGKVLWHVMQVPALLDEVAF